MKLLKVTLMALIIYACSNEDLPANTKHPEQVLIEDENSSSKLLRSVKSEHKTVFYEYNSDSTLHSITEKSMGETRNKTEFLYKDGKLSEITWSDAFNNADVK